MAIRKLKEIHAATHPGAKLGPRTRKAGEDASMALDAEELIPSLAAEAAEEDGAA